MQIALIKSDNRKPLGKLRVVRNFKQVIEERDMSLMNKELYQFLNLYCGFIAHYDINGFKAVYSPPKDFAEVFIRHFDREHRYFNGVYPCHEEPYKETGYTKAEIKREFHRIVDLHKNAISTWAEKKQRDERYAVYLMLKKEFEEEDASQDISKENELILKVKAGHFQYFQDLLAEKTSPYSNFFGIDPYPIWDAANEHRTS